MKIALIGATGYVGSHLLAEALERGHEVTAIVRQAEGLPSHPRLHTACTDATNADALALAVRSHDIVISAFNPAHDADGSGIRALVQGVQQAGVPRFLVVGGAGTLRLPNGQRVVDQPDFPAEWKGGALRTAALLELLQALTTLDWVFLSPAAMLTPGQRTGRYRVGRDDLLTDAEGNSRISLQDYAMAMLDEAERPQHHRQRFTVAY